MRWPGLRREDEECDSDLPSQRAKGIALRALEEGRLAAEQTLRLLNRGAGTGQDVIDIGYELVCRQSTPAISIPDAKA